MPPRRPAPRSRRAGGDSSAGEPQHGAAPGDGDPAGVRPAAEAAAPEAGPDHPPPPPPVVAPGSIYFAASDRGYIVGATGRGKSVAASQIARRWPRVLVYDPKVDDPESMLPGAAVAYGYRAALRALPGRVIYHPLPSEKRQVPQVLDDLCRVIFTAGAHGLVLHEAGDLGATDRDLGPWVSAVWRQGRSRRVPALALTQRPVNVPRMFLTEASHIFAFFLQDPRDWQVLVPVMGAAVAAEPPEPDFSFWYKALGDATPRHLPPLPR